ncbi:helix-turn-helix transcriptional regulator [Paenibacillus sp. Marseille-Q4541]|uniref:helix-turn-helix transcriptional regulator n=1 Tax=Paenibacillus sp. Marseille-Q4541 TaxID=2831522 RepID=UPI001BA5F5C6|nr:helix-turn-helix transcriptional regulator [Paenibacillus sp. Marseille-Q4541]
MRNNKMAKLRGEKTLRETAVEIGIPYSTYAMIEAGHRFPRKDLAIRIAKFYDTTVDELFFTLNDRVS